MAKYDQGGGCPCGLYRVCECDLEDVRAPRPKPAKAQPAAQIDATPNVIVHLTVSIREAIIQSLVDAIPKQFVQAVILRLMLRDEIARAIIMESMGEAAVKEHAADKAAQALYDVNKGEGVDLPEEKSWDEIGLKVIHEILDTPGGRGEVE